MEESQNFEAPVEVLDALIELAYTSKLNLTGGNMDTIGQLLRIASKDDITSLKKVAVKKAQAKQGKVYIGKLPAEVSDDEIKNHMATFGTIANIEQPFDKVIFLNLQLL